MKKYTLALLSIVMIAGCSSGPKVATPENTEDKVISRIDDMSSRPSWLKESEPFRIEDGQVLSLGQTTIPGSDRVEAGYRIASNSAKANVSHSIEQRLDFVFQNAEEGTSMDSTQARYIGAEASKLTTSSLRESKRYWEKVATTTDSGERRSIIKIFSLVVMPEQEFKRAVLDAVRKQQGKGGLSADFAQKVSQHWDQFVNATPEQKAAANQIQDQRKPASSEE